ncbi:MULTISPECIES: hypothetical protein [unclassified Streptomyces]|nr:MULTISPECIES: hypothetical protein [unclassified Streptomyces]
MANTVPSDVALGAAVCGIHGAWVRKADSGVGQGVPAGSLWDDGALD